MKGKILLITISLSLIFYSCSDSEKDPVVDPNEQGSQIERIITELEKNNDLTIFSQALKSAKLPDSNGPVTVFAVFNSAFGDNNAKSRAVISGDEVSWHVVKGAHTDLSGVTSLQTLGNHNLQVNNADVELDGKKEKLTYVNDVIVNNEYKKVGENIIYTTNKVLPKDVVAPSVEKQNEYFEWLARKVAGTWLLMTNKKYDKITAWEGEKGEVVSVVQNGSNPAWNGNLTETFNWEVVDKEKHIYGDIVLNSKIKDEDFCPLGTNGMENMFWGLISSQSQMDNRVGILYYAKHPTLNLYMIQSVNIYIDREFGVGHRMKLIWEDYGYSMAPPNMYPSKKECIEFMFVKIRN